MVKLFEVQGNRGFVVKAENYEAAAQLAAEKGQDLDAGLVWIGTMLDGDGEEIYRTVLDRDRLSNFPSASMCFFVRANSYGEAERRFALVQSGMALSNITRAAFRVYEDKTPNIVQKVVETLTHVTFTSSPKENQ